MIIKKIAVGLLTGASIATALLMIATAYSDRINPVDHPILACLGMAFPLTILANILMLILLVIFCWRRMWIPVIAFILCYVPIRTFVPLRCLEEPPRGSIKIMSYNVCLYSGINKLKNAEDSIFDYIAKQRADIVCTQEDQSTKPTILERWSQLFPYNDTVHISTPNQKYINSIGIHSRYPIVGKERIEYESVANGSIAWRLKIGNDTVIVINNHLESTHLSKDDRNNYKDMLRGDMSQDSISHESRYLLSKLAESMAKRAIQADAVHRYIEAHAEQPIILCGDFNDTPISYARHTIAKGLTDCFPEAGKGLGLSYNQKGFNFRIDYIMCSSHFEPYACVIDNKIDASDHYPISCWLKKVDKP